MQGAELRRHVRERFPEAIVSEHDFRGDDTLVMKREVLRDVLQFLRDDPALRFNMLMDLCGADHLELGREPRYEVIYHLFSQPHKHRLRLRFPVDEDDPVVSSVVDLWVGADFFERETFDMFGIRFKGHPNLRRILTHEGFEGHPLRKDYPVNRRQVLRPPVEDLLTPRPCKG